MAIEIERLLGYRVEDARGAYDRRDAALYALSVGISQDPTDDAQLRFADHLRPDFAALPSMALALGYPGFWLARPEIGLDSASLLHAGQTIRWHRLLPSEGEMIGRTRLTGLTDKGAGKHLLIHSERDLVDAASGELLATLGQTHIARGQGGCGSSGDIAPSPPRACPDRPADHLVSLATRPEQALIYRLNGDTFGLHSDPEMARAAGFDRPILHGMCSAAIVMHALLRTLADYHVERFRSLSLRFAAPLYPGESMTVAMWRDGAFRADANGRDVTIVDHGHLELA